jgi:hypothetical protein
MRLRAGPSKCRFILVLFHSFSKSLPLSIRISEVVVLLHCAFTYLFIFRSKQAVTWGCLCGFTDQ